MDQAFEDGAAGRAEVYLPWATFEAQKTVWTDYVIDHPSHEALEMAAEYHPSWLALRQGAKMLHGRNSHQIMGKRLDDPVDFVLCWTPDGSLDGRGNDTGGTGQALRIAHAHGIEVINMKRSEHRARVEAMLKG